MWGLKHPDLGVKHSDPFTEDDEYDILSYFLSGGEDEEHRKCKSKTLDSSALLRDEDEDADD